MRTQSGNDDRMRIRPDVQPVGLTGRVDSERELLYRRSELSINPRLVTARVDSIPAHARQVHRVETVQTERRAMAVKAQTLVSTGQPGSRWLARQLRADDSSRNSIRCLRAGPRTRRT